MTKACCQKGKFVMFFQTRDATILAVIIQDLPSLPATDLAHFISFYIGIQQCLKYNYEIAYFLVFSYFKEEEFKSPYSTQKLSDIIRYYSRNISYSFYSTNKSQFTHYSILEKILE